MIKTAGSGKSDAWITKDDSSSGTSSYDPWSPEFVKIQLGQLSVEIEENSQPFEIKESFMVKDEPFVQDKKIGEGNFASVYLCHSLFGDDRKFAIKVQKEAAPWEWVILKEAEKRVENSSISKSISDAISFQAYINGRGVLGW